MKICLIILCEQSNDKSDECSWLQEYNYEVEYSLLFLLYRVEYAHTLCYNLEFKYVDIYHICTDSIITIYKYKKRIRIPFCI